MSEATLKDKDRQQYYDTMESLHGHPGWALLMEDAARILSHSSDIDSIDATHSLDFRRGECHNLRWLLAQQAIHRDCYAQELAEQDAPEGAE